MPQTGRISNGVKGKIKEKNANIFGDWLMVIGQSHPQASLEAATRELVSLEAATRELVSLEAATRGFASLEAATHRNDIFFWIPAFGAVEKREIASSLRSSQ